VSGRRVDGKSSVSGDWNVVDKEVVVDSGDVWTSMEPTSDGRNVDIRVELYTVTHPYRRKTRRSAVAVIAARTAHTWAAPGFLLCGASVGAERGRVHDQLELLEKVRWNASQGCIAVVQS